MFRFLGIFLDFITNLLQQVGRDVVGNVFRLHRDEINLVLIQSREIDYAKSLSSAAPFSSPPEFAHASRVRNHSTAIGSLDERILKLTIFFIRQVVLDQTREEFRLNKSDPFLSPTPEKKRNKPYI